MIHIARDWRKRAVIVVPAVVTLVLAIAFWQDMRGTDDLGYAQEAVVLLDGDRASPVSRLPTHHEARLGMTLPLAAVISVLGPSDLSLALLPLFCTVLTASLVAWLGRRFWGGPAGLCAGLLYALFPLTIGLSTFYVPEPIATLELGLAGSLFLVSHDEGRKHGARLTFLAGLLIGAAYLTTEVGALMLPALYLYGLVSRRIHPRDAWLLGGFLVVLGGEMAYHAAVHGTPLYRFLLTEGYPDDPMVRGINSGDLTDRLLKAYPSMFVYPNLDFGLFGPLMLAGGVYGVWKWPDSAFLVIWAAAMLLFYNFMTASFSEYVALPVASRLLAPACLPLLMLAGKLTVDVWTWSGRRRTTALRFGSRALLMVGALALAVASWMAMYLAAGPNLTAGIAGNAKLAAGFLQPYSSVTLVSDRVSAKAIQFYRRYRPGDTFVGYAAAAALDPEELRPASGAPVFVVLNGPVLYEEQITGHQYGGGLTLGEDDRAALTQFAATAEAGAFAARFPRGRLLAPLLAYPAVRSLLGPYRYRVTRMLTAEDPPLSQVRVFPYERTGVEDRPRPEAAESVRGSVRT